MQSSFEKIVRTKPKANGHNDQVDKRAAKESKKLRKQQREAKRQVEGVADDNS